MKNRIRIITFFLVLAGLASLPAHGVTPQGPVVQKSINEFALKLLPKLAQPGKNTLISPFSISMALSMTANGAAGSTRTAMLKALQISDVKLDQINHDYNQLMKLYQKSDVTIDIANSLWGRPDLAFRKAFLKKNREAYDAKIQLLNFLKPGVASIINAWVAEQTQNKIEEIIDRVDPSAILYLINAIYFNGKWSQAFDKKLTKEAPFKLQDGTELKLPFMKQNGRYKHLKTNQFEAIALPYGKGDFAFYIFLPKAGVSVQSFVKKLQYSNWQSWMTQFRKMPGNISLPRFTLEYEVELSEALKALGMALAFSQAADFSDMVPPPLRAAISQVKHKTFMEVTEVGTEAAAATSVEVVMTASLPPQPFELLIDRPFVCAIRDERSGALLFIGAVSAPK